MFDTTEMEFMFVKDNLTKEQLIKLYNIFKNCNFNDKSVREVKITKIIASDIDIINTCSDYSAHSKSGMFYGL